MGNVAEKKTNAEAEANRTHTINCVAQLICDTKERRTRGNGLTLNKRVHTDRHRCYARWLIDTFPCTVLTQVASAGFPEWAT